MCMSMMMISMMNLYNDDDDNDVDDDIFFGIVIVVVLTISTIINLCIKYQFSCWYLSYLSITPISSTSVPYHLEHKTQAHGYLSSSSYQLLLVRDDNDEHDDDDSDDNDDDDDDDDDDDNNNNNSHYLFSVNLSMIVITNGALICFTMNVLDDFGMAGRLW